MQSRIPTPPPERAEPQLGMERAIQPAQQHPHAQQHGADMMAPPQTVRQAVHEITKKITIQDLNAAGSFIFHLTIVAVKQSQINYDPELAIGNLNASLQDSFNEHSGIEGVPAHMYYVSYVPPKVGAPSHVVDHGHYVCHVPEPFKDYTKIGEVMANLEYTGDDQGNRYKLAYADHVPVVYQSSRGGPRLGSKPTSPGPSPPSDILVVDHTLGLPPL